MASLNKVTCFGWILTNDLSDVSLQSLPKEGYHSNKITRCWLYWASPELWDSVALSQGNKAPPAEPTKLTTRRLRLENNYQMLRLFLLKKKCFQVFNKVSALGRSFSDWWTRKMSCNDTSTDTSNLFRHIFVTTLARTVRWWHHLVVIMETNFIVFKLQQQVVSLTDMFFRRIRACRKIKQLN